MICEHSLLFYDVANDMDESGKVAQAATKARDEAAV